jgi:hypothetical protein
MGFRFYLGLAGISLAIGAALFLGLVVFWKAAYAWGFLGGFLALAAVLLAIGWYVDRRDARSEF